MSAMLVLTVVVLTFFLKVVGAVKASLQCRISKIEASFRSEAILCVSLSMFLDDVMAVLFVRLVERSF